MTVAEVRALLRGRTEKCHDACPGWVIGVIDHCAAYGGYSERLTDEDVAELDEAQAALREAEREIEAEWANLFDFDFEEGLCDFDSEEGP